MKKLSIAIDMGAKKNGVYICKSDGSGIVEKKALCISIDGKNINFSKKSRRENRHKDRNNKRRRLAKRLYQELIDLKSYSLKEQETLLGLLKNRGYTLLSTEVEFEKLEEKSIDFFKKNYPKYQDLKTKEKYEEFLGSEFEKESEILEFLKAELELLDLEIKRKKEEFDSDFKDFFKLIKDDLKKLKEFLKNIKKEIETGSKPRKQYLKEIKSEIDSLDFIKDKERFYNLVGNISNLQLRVLRKFFNFNSQHKKRLEILKTYFKSHHYKKEDEKQRRRELFKELEKHQDLQSFLEECNPELTIPPYEDMNNRDTYKCNSMLIKPKEITKDLKEAIDRILASDNFSKLLAPEEFKKESSVRVKPQKGGNHIEKDYTYSMYLQRIFDATEEITGKELNPRNVFKHQAYFERGTVFSVDHFKKILGEELYKTLKPIAEKYYKEETKILNGIYEAETSILEKCNTNTPYKNNVKHTLLKPLYGYNFNETEAEKFLEKLQDTRGIKTFLERVSKQAKRNQNGFYSLVLSCYESKKCVSDKEIKYIVDNLKKNLSAIQKVLKELQFDSASFLKIDTLDEKNLTKLLNIFKQSYEILFKDLKGFNKTCKACTKENAIRSNVDLVIGKRLLSDVAKPIDGMLDMMLDRLSFEISKEINQEDLKGITTLEILLEQNKFEFEENLNDIKRKNNLSIKKFDPDSFNEPLNAKACPYTGESITYGDYDHILPQSDGLYNSKANLIYASVQGNREKGAKKFTLEELNPKHLNEIFKTDKKDEIKKFIKENLAKIDERSFKNFDRLNFKEQISLRYALFMRGTKEFTKAFNLVKKDRIKTFSNGTQKRLARLLYEKLAKRFPEKFKNLEINSKVVDSKLVSATRKSLSVNLETGEVNHLFKEEKQSNHSHCIDAMTVFYLANSKLKGAKHRQKDFLSEIEPMFDFDSVYMPESAINNISKSKTFISAKGKEIDSFSLFQGTIYSENYYSIHKREEKYFAHKEIKVKDIETLLFHSLIYSLKKGKKEFVNTLDEIEEGAIYKVDVKKSSDLIYKAFIDKEEELLKSVKFLDGLRFFTTRKEVEEILFDDKRTKLIDPKTKKEIPKESQKTFIALYKKLNNTPDLFTKDGSRITLNRELLQEVLKNFFSSKQKNPEQRKRGRKRHKYTLPVIGQNASYRVKRNSCWQVLGGENIATKNYIINGAIKPIKFFTKNTIPLKVLDLLDCMLIDIETPSVYEVNINVEAISSYVSKLKYLVTEKGRCSVFATFVKKNFDIDFNKITTYDGAKDENFQKFILEYIDNKEHPINPYVGSIRDGIKAKATLLSVTKEEISLQFKAAINKLKKDLILKNRDETHNH